MLRHLIIFLVIFFAFSAKSQVDYFYLLEENSLEERVKNILGRHCEAVSNVELLGGFSYCMRTFYNSEEIGLKGGIVFTTGIAPSSEAPDSYSRDGGQPGDTDISSSFNSYQPTFDASGIQFDLDPLESDTIRIRYVFASEEYTEFVGSNYNDRFLFLVSTNNGPFSNIAKLPNNQNVSVNTINNGSSNNGPCTNCEYYVSNDYGDPNYELFPYDGYTIPLIAKFYAQAGNHYRVKLVIADVVDNVFDSAIYLEEIVDNTNFSGSITTIASNDIVSEGFVEFYREKTKNSIQQPDYIFPVESNGYFFMDSILSGNYYTRYKPVVGSSTYFPMYRGNQFLWNNTMIFNKMCEVDSLKLHTDFVTTTNSQGSISGRIVRDSLDNQVDVFPFEGAVVYAWDINLNKPEAIAYSDANGNYTLTHLSNGIYRVFVDIPFLPQVDYYQLELRNEIDSNLMVNDYFVTDHSIRKKTESLSLFEFYPNPTSGVVVIKTQKLIDTKLLIYNHLGQLVREVPIVSNVMYFDTEELSEGLYFLRFEGFQPVERLMIIDDSKK